MTWETLFDRAAEYEMTLEQIETALRERRDGE